MEEREESEKEIKILLVEDLEAHMLLIKNALEESKLRERVFVTRDGEEALDFLFNRGDYASVEEYPKPDVILLDLDLPKIDGIGVLERVKREEKLKDIPVVVLTVSDREEDIIKTYEGGVKSYILKSTFFAKKKGKMEGLLDIIFSLIR
jgi:two-component system response regulator